MFHIILIISHVEISCIPVPEFPKSWRFHCRVSLLWSRGEKMPASVWDDTKCTYWMLFYERWPLSRNLSLPELVTDHRCIFSPERHRLKPQFITSTSILLFSNIWVGVEGPMSLRKGTANIHCELLTCVWSVRGCMLWGIRRRVFLCCEMLAELLVPITTHISSSGSLYWSPATCSTA